VPKSSPPISLPSEYTAVIKRNNAWWIGWIEEVPGANCQERSREKLVESLAITLEEPLEMNRRDTRTMSGSS
jgi:hypothetical protein